MAQQQDWYQPLNPGFKFYKRPKMSEIEAAFTRGELHAQSNLVAHIFRNTNGTCSVMSHQPDIVCDLCYDEDVAGFQRDQLLHPIVHDYHAARQVWNRLKQRN